jgi:signal transduction histidine kinase
VDVIDSANKIIRHVDVAGGLSDNNIQDFKQDNDGLMWLATNKSGVDIIDPVAGTIKFLNDQPGLRDTCNRVLLKDKKGRMWIGTDKGVYVADLKQGTLTAITIKEGLTDNRVLSLQEYNGSVAAGTNSKITLITPPGDIDKEWKIAPLEKSEALIKQQNSWASDYITSKGQYLWGDADLTVINDLKPATDSAVTYITGINVLTKPQYFINEPELKGNDTLWVADTFYISGKKPMNKGYATDNKLSWEGVSGPYNMPVNLQLPHNQNYIQFHFAQAYLGRQDNTLYTYVLEGIDKYWSTPNTNPYTENYLNLPPGKYTFRVCSKGLNGKWGLPASLSFTISPPWYQTWWAYTLYALLSMGLLRAYVVYRSRQLQRENKILEEKVNLRTKQLQVSIENLKSTQTQLIQSEKMASLGELTAGIAHEIQNPLNFVNNFSEVNKELLTEMIDEIDKGNISEVKTIANNIIENETKILYHGKRADSIVKGMLQHSRNSSAVKEPTDLNALCDEYLRLSYHGLRAKDKSFNATMKTDFDNNIGKINIIPPDIGRVVLNLLTNAFYAVDEKKKAPQPLEGGVPYEPTVSISTKKIDDKPDSYRVEIKVSDNGNGIPQKVLDKIFQPFFTTKPTGQGTGLGLSLSYDIIKAHGGEIKVETKEGEGVEFIIQLPL